MDNNQLEQANKIFLDNFPNETFFGRCIFLSWYCERGTCKFCFRSTTKHKIKHAEHAKRSLASILTDAIIGKNLGWPVEFLTGGYGIFDFDEIVTISKHVSTIYGKKIWVNLGALSKEEMEKLKPYVEGICASIETINPELHKDICPDKDIGSYEKMIEEAETIGLKKSITIVIGLGETKEDFDLLVKFIKKHALDRITFYALKPVQGTPYTESPDPDYYSWWIANTRIRFPKLKIMTGLTPKKVDYIKLLLEAGTNGITKFPAIRLFNSDKAQFIEEKIKESGRMFKGSLTKLPDIDWNSEVDKLAVSAELKESVKLKINQALKKMNSSFVS